MTDRHNIIHTDRPDGRSISTRGVVQHMMRGLQPRLAFDPAFSRDQFLEWQAKVRAKRRELMRFPDVPPQPEPVCLHRAKREGYTVEKWECYPMPGCVVPFLFLIPDGVCDANPAPAVLCFPGSTRTKENTAGEEEIDPAYTKELHQDENRMGMFYARTGIVAVVVDNPGVGETSDLEKHGRAPRYERETLSRRLLDMGWHYLGLSSFQADHILAWMKGRAFIDASRIAVSGHSLGNGPASTLAVLRPDIHAVVYNDFVCNNIQRAIVTTRPDETGLRPVAKNPCRDCVPGQWEWFSALDLLAALAPRPVIYTEGGAQSDLELLKTAYRILDAAENIAICHYPKYQDPVARRHDGEEIPEGLSPQEYLECVNVDKASHAFKADVAVPWLKKVLGLGPAGSH